MSEQLKAFYKAYAEWLDAGAPHSETFDRTCGLCNALEEFSECDYKLLKEMQQQFTDAGLNWDFPFDEGWKAYHYDDNKHLNASRVEWVRKHAEEESSR